jgi:hypothetical protein
MVQDAQAGRRASDVHAFAFIAELAQEDLRYADAPLPADGGGIGEGHIGAGA